MQQSALQGYHDKKSTIDIPKVADYVYLCSLLTKTAEHGEALLWSSWLEKHPETTGVSTDNLGTVPAPWDHPDTKVMWEKHATDTYYTYWESYSYWASQGWTADQPGFEGNTGGQESVEVTEILVQKVCDHETGAGDRETETKVDVLSELLGQSCSVGYSQPDGDCVSVSAVRQQSEEQLGGSEEPADGAADQTPAGTSQHVTSNQSGKCASLLILHTLTNSKRLLARCSVEYI